MKNVKFFLVSWLFLHICIFLPSKGQAEEKSVQDQNISEMNDQEGKNKEVQEQPEQVEMPSVEDEKSSRK